MPDLGPYAVEVLSAYAVSLFLMVVVVIASIWRARRVQARLDEVEHRRERAGS